MTDIHISTKDRPGSYDAIETAKPGEPLFPIQGGDPFGPDTVLHWADLARTAGRREADPKRADKLLRKASDAEHVAWAMRAYQRGEKEQEGKRAQYIDKIDVVDEGEGARKERERLIKSAAELHNIVAIGTGVVAVLDSLHVHPEQEVKLRDAIEIIRATASEIEPRRGNERS